MTYNDESLRFCNNISIIKTYYYNKGIMYKTNEILKIIDQYCFNDQINYTTNEILEDYINKIILINQ